MGQIDGYELEDAYEKLVKDLDKHKANYLMTGLPFSFNEDSWYVMRAIVEWGVPVTEANFQQIVTSIRARARMAGLFNPNVRFK